MFQMNFGGTSATTYSDSSGQLMYYTNGCYIRGGDYEPLLSCEGLNPGNVYESSCVNTFNDALDGYSKILYGFFLPLPESDSLVYLFHTDIDVETLTLPHFYYSRINTQLDGGRGDCDMLNVPLLPENDFGNVIAVRHANGRDWWLIIDEGKNNKYFRFLFSPEGISEPDSFFLEPEILPNYGRGLLFVSPDGSMVARWEFALQKIYLYDFNRCDGTFSNLREIHVPDGSAGGGAAFSPNNRFFYAMLSSRILQYDLWAEDVEASLVEVGEWNGEGWPNPAGYFMAQLAPDGRIYISPVTGGKGLNGINRPNEKGEACDVGQPALYAPHQIAVLMPYFPNYRLGPLDGSACDTLGIDNVPLADWRHEPEYLEVEFIDNSYYEPQQWYWTFGDGFSSTEQNPTHSYARGGVFEVCLTVSNAYGSHTLCRGIRLQGPGIATGTATLLTEGSYSVYPNPATEMVYLHFEAPLPGTAYWHLFDLEGRELQVRKLWCEGSAEGGCIAAVYLPRDLPSSVYMWRLEDRAGRLWARGRIVLSARH